MRKSLSILVIFVIISIWITSIGSMGHSNIYAQEPEGGEGYFGLNYADLGLSEEQVTKLQSLYLIFQAEIRNLRSSIEAKGQEIHALWRSYLPDSEKIIAKQKELNLLSAQVQEKMIIYRIEALKILTEEQAKKAISSEVELPSVFSP